MLRQTQSGRRVHSARPFRLASSAAFEVRQKNIDIQCISLVNLLTRERRLRGAGGTSSLKKEYYVKCTRFAYHLYE